MALPAYHIKLHQSYFAIEQSGDEGKRHDNVIVEAERVEIECQSACIETRYTTMNTHSFALRRTSPSQNGNHDDMCNKHFAK